MSDTVIKVFKNGTLVSETGVQTDDSKEYEVIYRVRGPSDEGPDGRTAGQIIADNRAGIGRVEGQAIRSFLADCGIADDNLADAHEAVSKLKDERDEACLERNRAYADVERLEKERDEATSRANISTEAERQLGESNIAFKSEVVKLTGLLSFAERKLGEEQSARAKSHSDYRLLHNELETLCDTLTTNRGGGCKPRLSSCSRRDQPTPHLQCAAF